MKRSRSSSTTRRASPARRGPTPVRARRAGGRRRQTVLAAATLTLLVAAAAFLFARPYVRTAAAAGDAAPDATLRISMSGWQPAVLEARAGQALTVRMVNLDNRFHTDGGGWHNFVVPSLGIEQRVPPEGTLTFDVAALPPGEYPFYCDICCGGKDNPYMQGTLVVS